MSEENSPLDLANVKCKFCGSQMKKVSWKVTAGAFDAGKQVEQTVLQCDEDKNTICIEESTGELSEFAAEFH